MRPYRKEKIASAVQQIIAEALVHKLDDPRLAPMTSVTRVEMSGDVQIAKVYLSIPGGETNERLALTALGHAKGHLRSLIAAGLPLRQCPELRFLVDQRAKAVQHTLDLIEENRLANPALFETPASDEADSEASAEGTDRPCASDLP